MLKLLPLANEVQKYFNSFQGFFYIVQIFCYEKNGGQLLKLCIGFKLICFSRFFFNSVAYDVEIASRLPSLHLLKVIE